jgi:hypothetical protein
MRPGERRMTHNTAILDGNEAAASVACRLTEVIAIHPITPASHMGEARTCGKRRNAGTSGVRLAIFFAQ